jgi:hypothetical protein
MLYFFHGRTASLVGSVRVGTDRALLTPLADPHSRHKREPRSVPVGEPVVLRPVISDFGVLFSHQLFDMTNLARSQLFEIIVPPIEPAPKERREPAINTILDFDWWENGAERDDTRFANFPEWHMADGKENRGEFNR